MAAPNLLGLTTGTAKTAVLEATTSATAIISNSAGSNKLFKVNRLWIANIDGTNAADITIDVFRSSTAYKIANTITVPADATLDFLSGGLYLEEGDSLRLTASANGDLQGICSYEELS